MVCLFLIIWLGVGWGEFLNALWRKRKGKEASNTYLRFAILLMKIRLIWKKDEEKVVEVAA